MTIYINIPSRIKPANSHVVLRDASELFRGILKVNRKSGLPELEVRTNKFKDGWFGHNSEEVVIAKVRKDNSATDSVDGGFIGTVEDVEWAT